MKKPVLLYSGPALVLLALAVVLLATVLLTSRDDLVSSTLVLIAFACFVSGLFLLAFQKKAGIDPAVASALGIPYTLNLARILSDLGVVGPARFVPVPPGFPAPVMQFNPVSAYRPVAITDDTSFYTAGDGRGVLSVPSGSPLFTLFEGALVIPGSMPDLLMAVRETGEDLLEVAESVTASADGDAIVVSFRNFLLIAGCRSVREESPGVCLLAPCPVCSITGMILAAGLQSPCTIEQVQAGPGSDDLVVHFRVNELQDILDSALGMEDQLTGTER
jgi:hypothetical protein